MADIPKDTLKGLMKDIDATTFYNLEDAIEEALKTAYDEGYEEGHEVGYKDRENEEE